MTGRWVTIPNLLSFSRLLVVGPTVWAVVGERWLVALCFYSWAVASDLADGWLARARQQVSDRGGVIDHSCDAAFVASALAAMAHRDLVPGVLPILVVLAFLQYVVDSRVLSGQSLRTSRLGRVNGINYYVLAGIAIFSHAAAAAAGFAPPVALWFNVLAWLLVGSTLVSMADRGSSYYRQIRGGASAPDTERKEKGR